AVVEAFCRGTLSSRLASLEVLRRWDAPVADMDPWRPETFSRQAVGRLEEWVDESSRTGPTARKEAAFPVAKKQTDFAPLSDEQLAEVRTEIGRLMSGTDAEASAAAERLATFGRALMPEVAKRLADAEADQDLRRLRMLRYRLLASDSLVLRWPGGVARLADTDPRVRQQAAEELVGRAKAADSPLLTALCGDPDALVREIGLRGLQTVGGTEATEAMAAMLADPEPNVRAAVLKQLEEKPQPAMASKVAEYLKTEKDADLIVHAVRVLNATKGREAAASLLPLLKHDVWQVRAEAAAALGEVVRAMPEVEKAKIYAALVELLADADSFVVSRAIEALAAVDLPSAVEPMIGAMERHPELATAILATLGRQARMREKALPKVLKMLKHRDPKIRAAVMGMLGESTLATVNEEILDALRDPASEVRTAAARLLFNLLDKQRAAAFQQIEQQQRQSQLGVVRRSTTFVSSGDSKPSLMESFARSLAGAMQGNTATGPQPAVKPATADATEKSSPGEKVKVVQKSDAAKPDKKKKEKTGDDEREKPNPYEAWVAQYQTGKDWPGWLTRAKEPLRTMLEAKDAKERAAAAAALAALGEADWSLPVVLKSFGTEPEAYQAAVKLLPWLPAASHASLFEQLVETADDQVEFSALLEELTKTSGRRSTAVFWKLLGKKDLPEYMASMVQHSFLQAYLGNNYYNPDQAGEDAKRVARRDARHWIDKGNDLQRTVAFTLLARVESDEAMTLAKKMIADKSLSEGRRRDVFRVMLMETNNKDREKAATLALDAAEKDSTLRQIALAYLAGDTTAVQMGSSGFPLFGFMHYEGFSTGQPIVPKPPRGLKPAKVRAWMKDADPKTAAYAAYLRAVSKRRDGLEALLKHWNSREKHEWEENRLVFRAIAALNDSTKIEELRKIYKETDQWRMREFYWTIRAMSGAKILELRKQIRDEAGMGNLR
ncbi:MAG TPA: HEAT repeat domain-containing protein, partial [Thermoguttaceae bacterium]|nr:HEAT repeat domain-containing protein [Thermoguttaceae bacterium]